MTTIPLTLEPQPDFAGHSTKDQLKRAYLECLGSLSADVNSLRQVVRDLLALQVDWRELVRWAVQAGHDETAVRKVLSEILCQAGIRRRQPGAGRETPQEALALLA